MSATPVFLPHIAGSCVTVGGKVHGLFRLSRATPSAEHRVGSIIASFAAADKRRAVQEPTAITAE